MLKKIIPLIFLLLIYSFLCNKIYKLYHTQSTTTQEESKQITIIKNNTQSITNKIIPEIKYPQVIEKPIGYIEIEKINLKNKLYPINSSLNNIERNVTILNYSNEPSENNSIMFIAAHSGTGKLAFFKNLNKLKVNDIIKLTYYNKEYNYIIKDIWETKKTGNIVVEKETNNQLVLTTCSPVNKDMQLIINSIQIKKES